MTGEFEKRIGLLNFDGDTVAKIIQLITEVAKEFPCQNCPSREECENYEWFLKWFKG